MIGPNGSNKTTITYFILHGINGPQILRMFFFITFLILYMMTLFGNLLIAGLFLQSQHLGSPMYFFLSHLSLCDIFLSSSVVPKLLSTLLRTGERMSIIGCFVQVFASGSFTGAECNLLTVMSYDRYVAICNPLRYTSIMSHRVCVGLILLSWLLGFGIILIIVYMVGKLQFCKHNTINHFFCDFTPLLELSCSDTFFLLQIDIIFSIPLVICPFIFIIGSYICIAHEILKIVSSIGRQKAFSTCSSHLAVVSIFFGTLTAIYVVPPRKDSQTISKVLSLLYAVAIPLVNPVIYSLRSKEMKDTLEKSKYHVVALCLFQLTRRKKYQNLSPGVAWSMVFSIVFCWQVFAL
uniref:Olfactory receptor n=1 Tax=Xenopus tropicalis TaxID=8364 RepID=A0A6I8PUQ8_XENTR